jgi:hypothetical protein
MTNRTDNFNRADSTTALGTPSDSGSNWVALTGTWGIGTNKGYPVSVSGEGVAYLESSIADCDVQVTTPVVSNDCGIQCRVVDASNMIIGWVAASTGWRIYKLVAGTYTQLGSTASGTPANNDVLKMNMSGNSLTFYANGVSKVAVSDSAHNTATKHGLRSYNTTSVTFDDFSITALAASFIAAKPQVISQSIQASSW